MRYTWDEQAGREGLDRALRVIDRARQHPSGRLDGVLYPAQVDTCTEALMRDSAAVARERRLPLQIHAVVNALRRLFADEGFVALLRAEAMHSLPRPLAEQLELSEA